MLDKQKKFTPSAKSVEKKRARDLARTRSERAGMSPALVESLLALQGNSCAICRRAFEKTPHADHNHDTGEPRGFLCPVCNIVEGHLKKQQLSPEEFARRLTEYLANPPAKTAALI